MRAIPLVCLLLAGAFDAVAAPRAVLLPGALLNGAQLADERVQQIEESSEAGTVTAQDLVAHESADGCLQTGVYETGRNRYMIDEPYPHDEFMYFVRGGVRLAASDGTVTEVAAGDGVLLPKGWTGTWDSAGYRKIYVIYGCKEKEAD